MSKIKSAKEMFKNWKTFEFENVVDDEIYVASGNDLKQYSDYVLKAKLESITDEVFQEYYLSKEEEQGAKWLKQKLLKD